MSACGYIKSLDNLTHTLFGATLGRAAFARAGRGTMAALLLASNAPDADIVAAAGGSLSYLAWHRGPTHGPLGVLGLSLATAGIVKAWQHLADRRRSSEHAGFGALVLASAAGLVGHVLMDLPTSYGTRLLSPFDWHWYAVDLMPIVDVYLLVALAAGLLVGRVRPALRQRAAAAVLACMALNYAVRTASHQAALALVPPRLASGLPPPCGHAAAPSLVDRWPRLSPAERREEGAARCLVEIALVPSFLSPFRWQMIVQLSDSYQVAQVNVLEDGFDRPPAVPADATWAGASLVPDQWTPAVLRAADSAVGRVFLDFSRFPATTSVLHGDRTATVTWQDLRFANVPGRPQGRTNLFVATVRVGPDGRIIGERLGE